jgi:hypothetical protein
MDLLTLHEIYCLFGTARREREKVEKRSEFISLADPFMSVVFGYKEVGGICQIYVHLKIKTHYFVERRCD